jgi:tRNA threonylcarbamoyl adenosine modification protein YeaZ
MLAVVAGDESRTHAERLPGEIARVLDQAAVTRERINLLAVATGPGAFTGLRIGLAAMQGLAMTLNIPVVGVSALEALAEQAIDSEADLIAPWMDAQRGDVFATLIDRRTRIAIEPPTAGSPKALLDAWQSHFAVPTIFIGDAVTRDAQLIEGPLRQWRSPGPLAPQIAIIGARREAEAGPPHRLEPIYVRRPDAEIERERRGSQARPERNPASEGGER